MRQLEVDMRRFGLRRMAVLMQGKGYQQVITPAFGANMIAYGGMEGDYSNPAAGIYIAPSWNNIGLATGADTAAKEETIVHGGSAAQAIVASAGNRGIYSGAVTLTLGVWYRLGCWMYKKSGAPRLRGDSKLATPNHVDPTLTNTWENCFVISRCVSAGGSYIYTNSVNPSAADWIIDDVAIQPQTLVSMLGPAYTTADGDFDIEVAVKCAANTQIGFACNLDSKTDPKYGVFVYIDRAKMYVDSLTNGVWASVMAGTTISYLEGRAVRIRKTGTTYSVYYGDVQIGADQTINDASINDNTLHCQFSTYEGNMFMVRPQVRPFA
jgi:hypothetical protein